MSTLALKFRPRTFTDVVGQPLVVDVLRNVIKEGLKYRSYIFSGLFGSGKTSVARILGKAVNCTNPSPSLDPCLECDTCLNTESGYNTGYYIEIDGATHGSIDSIRRIQEILQYKPMSARYTVVVIDEAHQLSTAAWNSCLKIVEEPPEHAIFIFVTTEHDRIPETIRSRCLDIRYGRMLSSDVVGRLTHICAKENIKVQNGTLELIVDHTQGVMRDAITLLEQFSILGTQTITLDALNKYIDVAYAISPESLVIALQAKDAKQAIALTYSVIDTNGDVVVLARKLINYLRGYWLFKNGVKSSNSTGSNNSYQHITIDIRTCLLWQEALIKFTTNVGHDRGLTSSLFIATLGKLLL